MRHVFIFLSLPPLPPKMASCWADPAKVSSVCTVENDRYSIDFSEQINTYEFRGWLSAHFISSGGRLLQGETHLAPVLEAIGEVIALFENCRREKELKERRIKMVETTRVFFAHVPLLRLRFKREGRPVLMIPIERLHGMSVHPYEDLIFFVAETFMFGSVKVRYDPESGFSIDMPYLSGFLSVSAQEAEKEKGECVTVDVGYLRDQAMTALLTNYYHGLYPDDYIHTIAQRLLAGSYAYTRDKIVPQEPEEALDLDEDYGPACKKVRLSDD